MSSTFPRMLKPTASQPSIFLANSQNVARPKQPKRVVPRLPSTYMKPRCHHTKEACVHFGPLRSSFRSVHAASGKRHAQRPGNSYTHEKAHGLLALNISDWTKFRHGVRDSRLIDRFDHLGNILIGNP